MFYISQNLKHLLLFHILNFFPGLGLPLRAQLEPNFAAKLTAAHTIHICIQSTDVEHSLVTFSIFHLCLFADLYYRPRLLSFVSFVIWLSLFCSLFDYTNSHIVRFLASQTFAKFYFLCASHFHVDYSICMYTVHTFNQLTVLFIFSSISINRKLSV